MSSALFQAVTAGRRRASLEAALNAEYLQWDNFEGNSPLVWSTSGGTGAVSLTTVSPMEGSNSMTITANTNTYFRYEPPEIVGGLSAFSMYLILRIADLPSTLCYFFGLDRAAGDNGGIMALIDGNGAYRLRVSGSGANSTISGGAGGGPYHIWFEGQTGSGDALARLYLSGSGNKPATPACQITTGSITTLPTRPVVMSRTSSGNPVTIDKYRLKAGLGTIGSNPL